MGGHVLHRLDKSFWVGASLFQYLVQGSTQNIDDFDHFQANLQSCWTHYVSFMNRSGQMVDYFMVYNFKVWWVGAW